MKILIAEDDLVSRRLLQATLTRWGYDVVAAETGTQAWDTLQQEDSPRLAILDWMMPGVDGVEICRRLREEEREPYTYVLLLTAKSQQGDIVEGLKAGADDYIAKPFDKHELEVRLRAGSRIIELQDELIQAREALREMAIYDPLTGVFNRRAIFEVLEKELIAAQKNGDGGYPAVLMSDLDHFKRINDSFGHIAGDAVLKEIARRMKEAVRKQDCVGRYGGEEFLIVLKDCLLPEAVRTAEALNASIGSTPVQFNGFAIPMTISIGVAVCDPTHDDCPQENQLLTLADEALYRAKSKGRNRVELAAQLPCQEGKLPPAFENSGNYPTL